MLSLSNRSNSRPAPSGTCAQHPLEKHPLKPPSSIPAPLNFPPHNVVDFQNFEKERTRLKDTVLINSNLRAVVATEAPEATSTPRPQSPTGLANEQYSDSSQWVQSSVLEFVQNHFFKKYIFHWRGEFY